ncbi:peptide deformylase [Pendulispora rubella]|uniref:Peptide deformylase n=1 Tax=Pendulispora rubella TaxID=2741070 RepID=A0ABZ2LL85_9BACT
MAIRKIATLGHPVLRQVARTLTRDELASPKMQALVDDLIETMRDANGAGIAANQVYEPVQLCVIHIQNNPRYPYKPNYPLTVLVNPEVTTLTEETFDNNEGCLSVPNLRGQVPRFTHVRVRAWNRQGEDLDFEVKGLTAGTFQHEIDHLQGKLFVDRVTDTRTLSTWADFERFHLAGFAERARALVARYGS